MFLKIETSRQKRIDELLALNESLNVEIKNANKTIASYQHIQLTNLNEIANLKKHLTEKVLKLKS